MVIDAANLLICLGWSEQKEQKKPQKLIEFRHIL